MPTFANIEYILIIILYYLSSILQYVLFSDTGQWDSSLWWWHSIWGRVFRRLDSVWKGDLEI